MIGKSLGRNGARAFEALHGFKAAPPAMIAFRLPRDYTVDLYKLTRIEGVRRVDMGAGPFDKPFYHDFKEGHGPTIAADADGWGFLLNGQYEITDHGIEDTMHDYMIRGRGGRFVPVSHYSQSPRSYGSGHYGQSNPWSPALSGLLMVIGGGLGGALLNAAIQAMPARVGDTVKDGVSLAVAGLAIYLPNGSNKLMGIGAAAVLTTLVINRRTDVVNRMTGYIQTKFAALYDRLMPGTPAAAETTTTTTTTTPTAGYLGAPGVDAFGLPVVQFADAYGH